MSKLAVLGLDIGRKNAKIAGADGYSDQFETFIGEARYLRNERQLEVDDNVFALWDGSSYDKQIVEGGKHPPLFTSQHFIGRIAREESEYSRQAFQLSKVNTDNKLMTLCAIARAIRSGIINNEEKVLAMVAEPIGIHTNDEKQRFKNLLLGEYTVKHNGRILQFSIERVEVGAEGAISKWGLVPQPESKTYHIFDLGSSTFNIATFVNGKWIDKWSLTYFQGAETMTFNPYNMAQLVTSEFYKKVRKQYGDIYLIGGLASQMKEYIQHNFSNVHVPSNPIHVTAKALYEAGVKLNAKEEGA